MKQYIKRVLTLLVTTTFAASTLTYYTPAVFAATTAHVRVVGANKTIWFGDITTDGCTVIDTLNVQHIFSQPVAICALDAAAKNGNFTYVAKDFGGSLGLFLQQIAEDAGAADFSTYWSYDINGNPASQGISNQLIQNGDSLYFHFEDPTIDQNKRAVNDGISYLRTQQQSTGEISGFSGVSGWAAMTFAAAGVDNPSLLDYLSANPPTTSSSATEWERAILAITASGKNPFSFGGTNYVQQLEKYHNNSQIGSSTQINDDIFGLLALLSAGTSAPLPTKQDALNFILTHQGADGGFSWSTTGSSDVDDTAAALQALSAAQKSGMNAANLSSSITNAKNYLLTAKNSDGGFGSMPGEVSNTSTTSWAVMALNSFGVTGTDVTNANAYMRGNQEESGSFKWQSTSGGETFTTSYAVLALTGKYWPVKVFEGQTPTPTVAPTIVPTSTPKPTVTPTITVSPTPTLTPGQQPRDRVSEIIRRQRERMQQIKNQIKELIQRLTLLRRS